MGPTEEQYAALQNEHGISKDEFMALDERDQQNLLNDVPDDTKPGPVNADGTPIASPEPTAAPVASPAPTTAPVATPAPTAAPQASPQPTAAPVATPAPTAAPVAAVVAPEVLAADPLGVGLVPDLIIPPPMVKAEDRAKLEANKVAIDDLDDKFAEGQLTKEEYRAAKKPLEAENERIQGDIAAERATGVMVQGEVNRHWDGAVKVVLAATKAAGLDFEAPENKDKGEELDAAILRFGKAAALIHPTKGVLWRDRWALAEAAKEVTGKYGVALTIHTSAPGAVSPVKQVPGPRPPADLTGMPPTLRGAPEAGSQNIQAGEFAHLDGMSLPQREKAIALMTTEQLDRYLDA